MKKLLIAASVLLAVFIFASCKKDKDDTSSHTHKVMYKASVTNAVITDVSYTDGTGQQATTSGINDPEYTGTEISLSSTTVPVLTFMVNGTVNTDSTAIADSATVNLQILVDGNVVKSDTSKVESGSLISATTSYTF